MKLSIILTLSSVIYLTFSQTCTNEGGSVLTDEIAASACADVAATLCLLGIYINAVDHTCAELSVDVDTQTLLELGIGNERCACIDAVDADLAILIDANPSVVSNEDWATQIIGFLQLFSQLQEMRLTGGELDVTFLFLHGNAYLEVTEADLQSLLSDAAFIASNPFEAFASIEEQTLPCDAINRALEILNQGQATDLLFYLATSTPDLTGCVAVDTFADISTYAVRDNLDISLTALEAIYGSLTQCAYVNLGDLSTLPDINALANLALVATLSDFICPEITPSPTQATGNPGGQTSAPTRVPSLSTSAAPTTARPTTATPTTARPTIATATTASPTSKPTEKSAWWNDNNHDRNGRGGHDGHDSRNSHDSSDNRNNHDSSDSRNSHDNRDSRNGRDNRDEHNGNNRH